MYDYREMLYFEPRHVVVFRGIVQGEFCNSEYVPALIWLSLYATIASGEILMITTVSSTALLIDELVLIKGDGILHVMSKSRYLLVIGLTAKFRLVIEGISSLVVVMTIFGTSRRYIVFLRIMLHCHLLRSYFLSTYLTGISYSNRRCLRLISYPELRLLYIIKVLKRMVMGRKAAVR